MLQQPCTQVPTSQVSRAGFCASVHSCRSPARGPAVSVQWRERIGNFSRERCFCILKSKNSCSLFKNKVYVSVLYRHFYRQRNLIYVWH